MSNVTRRNVTVVLDDETARWVRVEAAKADRSVSQYLADILLDHRARADGYESWRRRFLARSPRALRSPETPLPRRDQIHERGR